jgi:putative ABC transport system permease protein
MFNHYLTTAWRYFGRNRFTTSINVLCLTLGMVCFAVAYGTVTWFTKADLHYEKSDRIYFASEGFSPRNAEAIAMGQPRTSWVLGKLLRADFPQLEAVARLTPGREAPVAYDDKSAFVNSAYADPEFLKIFGLPFIRGDAQAALGTPRSAIVTQATAERLFGTTDVIGKTLLLNNRERVAVTGVISELKQPSHFSGGLGLIQFDLLASMDTYESMVRATGSPTKIAESLDTWAANMGTFVYLLAPKGDSFSLATLNTQLAAFTKRHAPTDQGQFFVDAHPIQELYSNLGDGIFSQMGVGISSASVLLILGGLILLVSCINYANLATAQLSTRTKEVAMRRVVGAGRSEIVRQYLFETALLTFAALILVLLFVVALLAVLSVQAGINLLGAALLSPELWLTLLTTLCIVTLLAGAYPSLVLSRMTPSLALRTGLGASGPRFVPTLLVGLQFGAASFLLIALLVMQSQNKALNQQRESISGEPVVAINTSVIDAGVDMQVLRSELQRTAQIEVVASADEIPGGLATGNHRMVGRSLEASAARNLVTTNSIDHQYFKSLQIGLLAGRTFEPNRRDEWNQDTAGGDDVMNVVINRALAEQSGWTDPSQAVGQVIYGHAGLGEHALTMRVIGVVETRALAVLGFGSVANIYTLEQARATRPIIRLTKTDTAAGIAAIETVWKKLSPNVPARLVFLDEAFERSYRFIPMISSVFAALALFAFVISAMGLVGMATHVTARRTREIGVRKTLGASVASILSLLLRDFSKPVIIANLAMWPLAYVVMQGYVSMFMVQTTVSIAPFLLGLAITAGIACAAVAAQATKAAKLNPAMVLRTE